MPAHLARYQCPLCCPQPRVRLLWVDPDISIRCLDRAQVSHIAGGFFTTLSYRAGEKEEQMDLVPEVTQEWSSESAFCACVILPLQVLHPLLPHD